MAAGSAPVSSGMVIPGDQGEGDDGDEGAATGACTGTLPQAASIPTISAFAATHRRRFMSLILLEALGAMVLLIVIVWWTMFSGRKGGELKDTQPDDVVPGKDLNKKDL